jgi:hypothetical protein
MRLRRSFHHTPTQYRSGESLTPSTHAAQDSKRASSSIQRHCNTITKAVTSFAFNCFAVVTENVDGWFKLTEGETYADYRHACIWRAIDTSKESQCSPSKFFRRLSVLKGIIKFISPETYIWTIEKTDFAYQ